MSEHISELEKLVEERGMFGLHPDTVTTHSDTLES